MTIKIEDLERSIIRAARPVVSKSPVQDDICPYCDGKSPNVETGFVHEKTCFWTTLARAVATLNIHTLAGK